MKNKLESNYVKKIYLKKNIGNSVWLTFVSLLPAVCLYCSIPSKASMWYAEFWGRQKRLPIVEI